MITYILKPTMTCDTVAAQPAPGKLDDAQTWDLVNAILPDALKNNLAPAPEEG